MYSLSYPLKKEGLLYDKLLKPTLSLRYSPNNTKNISDVTLWFTVFWSDYYKKYKKVIDMNGQLINKYENNKDTFDKIMRLKNDEVKKKISLIDELMIEDINNLSISELEENISALKMIIDKYFKKIEEKKLSKDKAESIFK